MNRFTSHARIDVPWLAFLVAFIVCVTLAPPVAAGFNPLKKAKDAVTKPAEKKATGQKDEPPVFDEYTLELTDARLDAMMSACKKAAEAGAGRPALVEKLNKVSDDRAKLDDKQGRAVRDLQQKRSDVEGCYHEGYNEAMGKRREEFAAKAMSQDPALVQQFTRLAQEQATANAKGDTASVQRINATMMQMMAPTKEDSLKVKQKCGPIPPHSAAEDQLAAFDKQIAGINEQIRVVDENVAKAQAKAGGMTQEQWATARERLMGYIPAPGKKPPADPPGFSDDEIDALEKHVQQLQDARASGCL